MEEKKDFGLPDECAKIDLAIHGYAHKIENFHSDLDRNQFVMAAIHIMSLYYDHKITGPELGIYLYMLKIAIPTKKTKTRYFYQSISKISKETKISIWTVKNGIKKLRSLNLLLKLEHGQTTHHNSQYLIIGDYKSDKDLIYLYTHRRPPFENIDKRFRPTNFVVGEETL